LAPSRFCAFRRNGNHPGAVHYIVHAFDEPSRAIVGSGRGRLCNSRPTLRTLHMPSHIYVQLGQWDKLSAANERSCRFSQAFEQSSPRDRGAGLSRDVLAAPRVLMQGNFAKAEEAGAGGTPREIRRRFEPKRPVRR
jgi:hypothetical protein